MSERRLRKALPTGDWPTKQLGQRAALSGDAALCFVARRPLFQRLLPAHNRRPSAAAQDVRAGMESARLARPLREGVPAQHPCACSPSQYLAPLPAALSPPSQVNTPQHHQTPAHPSPLGLVASHTTPLDNPVPPLRRSDKPHPHNKLFTVNLPRSTRTPSFPQAPRTLSLRVVNHSNCNHVHLCRQCHRPDGQHFPREHQRARWHPAHGSRERGCPGQRRRGQATLYWKPRVRDHRGGVEGLLQGLPCVSGAALCVT